MDRVILHVDMDAFYASVEQRDDPSLRGQPTLVGGMHRGVVAAASYESRKFGIHSAMPMAEALRRCPHARVVKPRYHVYAAVSAEIFAIFSRYTPLVEGLSLDEAFLDVSGSQTLFGDGTAMARRIKEDIRHATRLTGSAGVAPCKFVAKIASDFNKPDGLTVVPPALVQSFLAPLPVERMWGVGPVAASKLRRFGLSTLGQLATANEATLALAGLGPNIAALARGEDSRPVVADAEAKSIGAEETFVADISDPEALKPHLLAQSLKVASRLNAAGMHGYTIVVKLKDTAFNIYTRRQRQSEPIVDADSLYAAACALLQRFGLNNKAVRLCGVAITDLEPGPPPRVLFEDPHLGKRRRVQDVTAQIQERFGSKRLTRATLLATDAPDREEEHD